jgi:RNA polymerase sigma-70 factor (ECF subfamily)
MTSITHPTLLDRLRDGEEPLVWSDFFHRYWPVIYGYARRRGCSEHTGEEIVQEVLLKVLQNRDVFRYNRERGRFRDWLATVVRHQVAEYRRRPAQRVRGLGGESVDPALEPAAEELAPDEAWETAYERGLLLVLLDVVRRESDPRDYLAFELTTLGELSPEAVARITGLSRNCVYKARRKLMKRLSELAGPYQEGRLHQQIRETLESRPVASVERTLTTQIQQTMGSYGVDL